MTRPSIEVIPEYKRVVWQAFAAPERLAEMAGKVREALAGPLPAAVARMRLYLANPATHAILFKPIKSNIAEAHGQAGLPLFCCKAGAMGVLGNTCLIAWMSMTLVESCHRKES